MGRVPGQSSDVRRISEMSSLWTLDAHDPDIQKREATANYLLQYELQTRSVEIVGDQKKEETCMKRWQ